MIGDKELFETVDKLDKAFNNKDIEAVLAFYDDAATVVVEPGKCIEGKIALRNMFEKIFELNYMAKQEKMQVIQSGNLALFISKWVLMDTSKNEATIIRESCATCVFRKNQYEQWRLVIDNSFGTAILDF